MKITKAEKRFRLMSRLAELGIDDHKANALRRIEMTLHRWAELECGTGDDRITRSIERDEATGKPLLRVQYSIRNGWNDRSYPCADREKGALRRLGKLMACFPELIAYHQTDPRGCSLYILRKSDLNGSNIESTYTKGVAVCD